MIDVSITPGEFFNRREPLVRNVNKTMRDDAMPMRGAYDAPRATMSPMSAEGDRGRWGRVETDSGRVTIFVIRDSSIS
jgi:hypothetical protein